MRLATRQPGEIVDRKNAFLLIFKFPRGGLPQAKACANTAHRHFRRRRTEDIGSRPFIRGLVVLILETGMRSRREALVPGGGIEPPRAEARRILSPLRLPVPPSRLYFEVLDSTANFASTSLPSQTGDSRARSPLPSHKRAPFEILPLIRAAIFDFARSGPLGVCEPMAERRQALCFPFPYGILVNSQFHTAHPVRRSFLSAACKPRIDSAFVYARSFRHRRQGLARQSFSPAQI